MGRPGLAHIPLPRCWRPRWPCGVVHNPRTLAARLAATAAVAAVPAAWYGVEQALYPAKYVPPDSGSPSQRTLWAMGMLAFMVVLVVAAAAPTEPRVAAWGEGLEAPQEWR